jgi:hypothetical protein
MLVNNIFAGLMMVRHLMFNRYTFSRTTNVGSDTLVNNIYGAKVGGGEFKRTISVFSLSYVKLEFSCFGCSLV